MRRAKKFLFWSAVIAVGFLLLFIGAVEITSRPSFCGSCHIMVPYVQSWKTSNHNKVSCTKCHYTPGVKNVISAKMQGLSMTVQYFTGTAGPLPWANVEDASCLRAGCHSERLLAGKVSFQGVIFDHFPHLTRMKRAKILRCASCHSQIVQGTHVTVTESTCFLCHFKEVELGTSTAGCLLCHTPDTRGMTVQTALFNHAEVLTKNMDCQQCHAQVVTGTGWVPKDRCLSCHNEPQRLAQIDDHFMLHRKHVTETKIECMSCHQEIQHSSIAAIASLPGDCSACHSDLHNAVKAFYMGKGAEGVPESPAPMFLSRVDCKGCHTLAFGEVSRASVDSCIKCHNEQVKFLFEGWKKWLESAQNSLRQQFENTRTEIAQANLPAKKKKDVERTLQSIQHNLAFVHAARGIHNVAYAESIFTSSQKRLNDIRKEIGAKPFPPIAPHRMEPSAPCLQCHTGMEFVKVPIQKGKEFPHYAHIVWAHLNCQTCHGLPHEAKGKRVQYPEGCNACHHKLKETHCQKCHDSGPIKEISFAGKMFPHKTHIDLGLECSSCHEAGGKIPSLDIVNSLCTNCHESSFFATTQK